MGVGRGWAACLREGSLAPQSWELLAGRGAGAGAVGEHGKKLLTAPTPARPLGMPPAQASQLLGFPLPQHPSDQEAEPPQHSCDCPPFPWWWGFPVKVTWARLHPPPQGMPSRAGGPLSPQPHFRIWLPELYRGAAVPGALAPRHSRGDLGTGSAPSSPRGWDEPPPLGAGPGAVTVQRLLGAELGEFRTGTPTGPTSRAHTAVPEVCPLPQVLAGWRQHLRNEKLPIRPGPNPLASLLGPPDTSRSHLL